MNMYLACAVVAGTLAISPGYAADVRGVVTGKVNEQKTEVVPSATIRWRSTTVGTLSKADGTFTIRRVTQADTLDISAVGYQKFMVVLPADSVSIVLEPIAGDEVVVTENASINTAPVRTEVISRHDLSKAACCSLAESFEKSPTVEVSYSDATTGARQIQLLGLRGQYTQFLMESVPLLRSQETPFGLEHIPGPFMQAVSISKGAASVATGHESMTGQINVTMHDPFTAPMLFVNVYGNSMSRMEANVYGAQRITDELATMTMLHVRAMPHAPDNNNDGFLDMPTFSQINAVHRWIYNDDELEVQAWVRGLKDSYDGGSRHMGTHEGSDHPDTLSYDIRTDITRFDGFLKVGLLNAFESIEGSSIAMVLSGGDHEQQSTLGLRNLNGRQRTVTARALALLPFTDDSRLFAGVSGLYEQFSERLDGTSFARNERELGVFAEWTWNPVEDVTLITGLRADDNSVYGGRVTPRLHAKWAVGEFSSFRGSIGRGWRAPSVIVENMSAFVNNRTARFDTSFRAEDSWNAGLSYTTGFDLWNRSFVFDAEIYRTEFTNQVVVDLDQSAREVIVSNLNGKSWSTSMMAQLRVSPIPRLEMMLAGRYVDIQAPYGGRLQQRPLTSRVRALLTASWTTEQDRWQVDATLSWNGSGRIPSTTDNPVDLQRSTTFPAWWRLSGQVTHRMGNLDIYVGSENITNFIQQQAVISSNAPQSAFFDASLVWGPMDSRLVYAGIRFTLPHNEETSEPDDHDHDGGH